MDWQTVIDKNTGQVLRAGYCDFANDGSFNSETEEIITGYFECDPKSDYTYNSETETFDKGDLRFPANSDKYLRIYAYMDDNTNQIKNRFIVPKDFNYKLLPLFKDIVMIDGDITEIIYYGDYSGSSYSIPVIKESFIYTYENNIPTNRELTISWYCEDGTTSPENKVKNKKYNKHQGEKAIKQKRDNIISSMKINLVGYLLSTGEASTSTEAHDIENEFIRDLGINISLYIEGDFQSITDAITAATDSWLDNTVADQNNDTIRTLLINELNYNS